MNNAIYLFLLSLLVLSLYCDKNPASSKNNPPLVNSIEINGTVRKIQSPIQLTAVVTDKDGDTISLTWSSSGGIYYYNHDNPNPTKDNPTWWVTDKPGAYQITCTASDGKDTGSKTISITIE